MNELDNNDYGSEVDFPFNGETPIGEEIDGGNDHVADDCDGGLDENDEMVDADDPNEEGGLCGYGDDN